MVASRVVFIYILLQCVPRMEQVFEVSVVERDVFSCTRQCSYERLLYVPVFLRKENSSKPATRLYAQTDLLLLPDCKPYHEVRILLRTVL